MVVGVSPGLASRVRLPARSHRRLPCPVAGRAGEDTPALTGVAGADPAPRVPIAPLAAALGAGDDLVAAAGRTEGHRGPPGNSYSTGRGQAAQGGGIPVDNACPLH